jgi:hypothetical protein
VDKQTDLISRLQDEADLCRNDGATDIAALLYEAVAALQAPRPEVAGAWGEPVLLPCDCKDAEIGRQWRENSRLEKWFPITAERLARLEQWARDCRDQVLYPAAQREDAIGKAADGLGQVLVDFHLGPNAALRGAEPASSAERPLEGTVMPHRR